MSSVNVLDEARRHGVEAIISNMSEAFVTNATKRLQEDITVVGSPKKVLITKVSWLTFHF